MQRNKKAWLNTETKKTKTKKQATHTARESNQMSELTNQSFPVAICFMLVPTYRERRSWLEMPGGNAISPVWRPDQLLWFLRLQDASQQQPWENAGGKK